MKRTASGPTSSTTSRNVTNSPARFDIFTGPPPPTNPPPSTNLHHHRPTTSPRNRPGEPLHVASASRAKHDDNVGKVAGKFLPVISDVRRDVSGTAIRFENRPIYIVAELRSAEQQQLAGLPILQDLSFRRRQRAAIEQPLVLKERDRLGNLARPAVLRFVQRAFGKEHLVLDTKRGKLAGDKIHHAREGDITHRRQPFAFIFVP